nr:unnamed protein product [Digitaria exilis]
MDAGKMEQLFTAGCGQPARNRSFQHALHPLLPGQTVKTLSQTAQQGTGLPSPPRNRISPTLSSSLPAKQKLCDLTGISPNFQLDSPSPPTHPTARPPARALPCPSHLHLVSLLVRSEGEIQIRSEGEIQIRVTRSASAAGRHEPDAALAGVFRSAVESARRHAGPSSSTVAAAAASSSGSGGGGGPLDGTIAATSARSEFNNRASKIGLGIHQTSQKLARLAKCTPPPPGSLSCLLSLPIS